MKSCEILQPCEPLHRLQGLHVPSHKSANSSTLICNASASIGWPLSLLSPLRSLGTAKTPYKVDGVFIRSWRLSNRCHDVRMSLHGSWLTPNRLEKPTTRSPADDRNAWQILSFYTVRFHDETLSMTPHSLHCEDLHFPITRTDQQNHYEPLMIALRSLKTLSVPKSLASKRMTNSPPPGHSRHFVECCGAFSSLTTRLQLLCNLPLLLLTSPWSFHLQWEDKKYDLLRWDLDPTGLYSNHLSHLSNLLLVSLLIALNCVVQFGSEPGNTQGTKLWASTPLRGTVAPLSSVPAVMKQSALSCNYHQSIAFGLGKAWQHVGKYADMP